MVVQILVAIADDLVHRPPRHRRAGRHRAGLSLPDADDEHRHGRHGRQRRLVDGACPGRRDGSTMRALSSLHALVLAVGERAGLHRVRLDGGARALRADGRLSAARCRRASPTAMCGSPGAVLLWLFAFLSSLLRGGGDAATPGRYGLIGSVALRAAGGHPGAGCRPMARARPRRACDRARSSPRRARWCCCSGA